MSNRARGPVTVWKPVLVLAMAGALVAAGLDARGRNPYVVVVDGPIALEEFDRRGADAEESTFLHP